jgi:hypothetical protein
MSSTPEHRPTGQPRLADLMARYLGRQTAAVAAGMEAARTGEVEPHEAVPVHSVDPKQAWDEATAVLSHFGGAAKVKSPMEWPNLVAAQPSHTGLAFAAGNFPQMVRDVVPLYRSAEDLSALPLPDAAPLEFTGEFGPAEFPHLILAAGALRLARQYAAAEKLLKTPAPAKWAEVWANEYAALLWHQGRKAEAIQRWRDVSDSVPVKFNRGMAALFTGRMADARTDLRRAVEQTPEASGWHHLGRLYLALAGG